MEYTALTAEQVDAAVAELIKQQQEHTIVATEAKQQVVSNDVRTEDVLDISSRRINAPTYRF